MVKVVTLIWTWSRWKWQPCNRNL